MTPVENRTITNASMRDYYKPQWWPMRVGADDHEAIPTRINDELHYRDGTVKEVTND